MKHPKACLIVFAKEPVAGKVKTRLIPALGAEGAKDLHIELIQKLFKVINNNQLCDSQLWVDRNPEHPVFSEFLGAHKVQSQTDLGLRMHHASVSALQNYEQVVIIGSDCPQMSEAYLELALLALKNKDVVIGPATDGGYVLVGMSKPVFEIFQEIDWGTDKVMAQTREQLQNNGISWEELPELFDIDRPEDLKLL